MKFTLIALAFISHAAFALPVVCESYEKTNGISTLRVKINGKVSVKQNDQVWTMNRIGVTPNSPGERQTLMYGSGDVRPESISMTMVKDGFVYGYVSVRSPSKNASYEGKIRIGGILRGRVIDVRCTDENPPGEII